jgi:hypothetical protein
LNQDDRKHATIVKNTMIFNAFVLCQVSFPLDYKYHLLYS